MRQKLLRQTLKKFKYRTVWLSKKHIKIRNSIYLCIINLHYAVGYSRGTFNLKWCFLSLCDPSHQIRNNLLREWEIPTESGWSLILVLSVSGLVFLCVVHCLNPVCSDQWGRWLEMSVTCAKFLPVLYVWN